MLGKWNLWVAAAICCGGWPALAQPANDNFASRATIPLVTNETIVEIIQWQNGAPVTVSVISTNVTFAASGSLSNATSETDEPFAAGVSSGQTAWWTWTAPSNGIVALSADADVFSPLLAVYTGNELPGLSLIASNNYLICYEHTPCGCHWRERNQTTFHVEKGQAYQICVDSAVITDAAYEQQTISVGGGLFTLQWAVVLTTNVPVGGDVTLKLEFTPAPPNDDFVNRLKLSGSRISTNSSNAGATREPGEPDHPGNPGGSSVWYSWTAPASGRVTLSTNEVPAYAPPDGGGDGGGGVIIIRPPFPPDCGNAIDQNPPPVFYPIFAAYTGNAVDSLTSANCLPAELDAFPDMVEFDVVKGQTYQIAFDGNQGTTWDIPLYLALTTPPPNDSSQDAITLHGVFVTATGYNAGAVRQTNTSAPFFPPGPPIVLPPPGYLPPASSTPGGAYQFSSGKNVWWSWTAPVSGTVLIDLSASDYAFPVAVSTTVSSGINGQQMTAWITGGSGGLSFNAIEGHTYKIAVGDYNGLTGAIKLTLQAPIVDLPLARVVRPGKNAVLIYAAAPGEVVALLHSTDNQNWEIVQTKTAVSQRLMFQVKPAPTRSGPFYRAILFDWTGTSHPSHFVNNSSPHP